MKIFSLLIVIILIMIALGVTFSKKILTNIIIFTVYSLLMSLLWLLMEAPDLALTEAAVGAGATTAIFIFAYSRIRGNINE